MGCGNSKNLSTTETPNELGAASGQLSSKSSKRKGKEKGKKNSLLEKAKEAETGRVKSLSSYNKTKGGSMLFNLASKELMNSEEATFADDQHIMSPSKPDWKIGKSLKRAPTMKKTHYVQIPCSDGRTRIIAAVGYNTLQGRNPSPPHKPNQDSLSIFTVDGCPNITVFTVLDGHGPFGEHASHFVRSRLHEAFAKQEVTDILSDPKKALSIALNDVHQQFISMNARKTGVDPMVSGTTCITVMLHGEKMYTANVGDSRAILGSISETRETIVTELSDDHKPQRPDEQKRLQEANAILLTEKEVRGFGDGNKIYICRQKGGDIVYGVLFTRSLGDADAHEHLGVSAEPEFTERTVRESDRYLVLASDGVWDYMTNEEVMSIVFTKNDPLAAADEITKVASEQWETKDLDQRRDDITVMVVKLDIEDIPKIKEEEDQN